MSYPNHSLPEKHGGLVDSCVLAQDNQHCEGSGVSLVDSRVQQVGQLSEAFLGGFLANTQTYWMEFDVHSPFGRLPACFAREFGDAISDYVILRDPCHNEFEVRVVRESGVVYFGDGWHNLKDAYDIRFGAWVTLTYVSPILLAIRVLSRWCVEVDYPNYDPPLRHLLARSDPRCRIGSSVVNICSPGSSRPKTLIRSYVKDLTLYDIHSGVLVLPWYGFGESAFAFVFSDLILVDNAGVQYKCGLKFGVNGSGELSCNVYGGWHDLCVKHAVVEGDRVKFSIAHYSASNVMYVSIYPRIRVEDYLKLDGNDS